MTDSSIIPLHFRPVIFGSMSSADVDFRSILGDIWPQEKITQLQNTRKSYIHTSKVAFSEDILTTSFNSYACLLNELIADINDKADCKVSFSTQHVKVV